MTNPARSMALKNLGSIAKRLVQSAFVALIVAAAPVVAVAQTSIEMAQTGGNTTTQGGTTHVLSQVVTMQTNSDNPTGSTFTGITPAPGVTATYTLSNFAHNAVPTTLTSTQKSLIIGSTGTGNVYYSPLSGIGSPANAHFTALPTNTAGTGIGTGTNYGVRMTSLGYGLFQAGSSQIGRHYMGDLEIVFSAPVVNPVLHFSGLGGSYGPKGFATEFTRLATPNVTGMTLLSGNGSLGISGNDINNTSAAQGANCTAGSGACGSVQFTGSGITTIRLQVYLQSDQAGAWADNTVNGQGAGDAFHISASTETADMSPAFSGLPTEIVPGQSYSASLVCTNAGPNTARNSFCTPTVNLGTISGLVCTPTIPADIGITAPNNRTTCTFNYVLTVGGTQTGVIFTGQTGSGNDRNGGLVGSAGNNQVTATVPVRAPRLTMTKVLNGNPGRNQASDQFTLTVTGSGGPASTTTTGSGTTVSNGSAQLTAGVAGQTYTFTETYAGTASAALYTSSYSCSNALSGGTSVGSGSGTTYTTPALVSGDDITCVFTNTFTDNANLQTAKTRVGGSANVNDGDTVTFLITVTNNGPAIARNVTVTDTLPTGLTAATGNGAVSAGTYTVGSGLWSIPTLASGASATLTLRGTVNAGLGGTTITNTTTAADGDGNDPSTAGDDLTEAVTVIPNPRLSLTKVGTFVEVVQAGRQNAGDRIDFTFVVTNTGNVALTSVQVTDPKITTITGSSASLAPGAQRTFTGSYTLTQADIDSGGITNQATGSGRDPSNTLISDASDDPANTANVDPNTDGNPDDPTVVPLTRLASMTLAKAAPTGTLALGQTITYTVTATNTGAVTLTAMTVTDPMLTPSSQVCATVAPAGTCVLTGTHVVTQAELDAGNITNTAQVGATPPSGVPAMTPVTTTRVTPLTRAPSVALVKTGLFVEVLGSGVQNAGDRVDYTITVTNTGNVTVTGIVVTDPLLGGSLGTIASLVPGASQAVTGSYTLTQANIDAGSVQNQATGSGRDPSNAVVSDSSDESGTGPADNDPTIVALTQAPSLGIDKRLAASSPTSFSAVGAVLSYEFVVTNTGNTTITDAISINDPKIPSGISCPPGALAPGASKTCTGGAITVAQSDINAGSLANTARAYTGPLASPTLQSAADTVTVPAVQTPGLTVDKSTTQTAPSEFIAGNTISYSYLVTNSGNTTLTTAITVSDNLIPSVSCPALPGGGLAPGGTLTCTGSYTITVDDLALGSTTNVARASSGGVTSPSDSVILPAGANPALSIAKSVASVSGGAATFSTLGQVIRYSYLVTNSGNAPFVTDVYVYDDQISPGNGDILCRPYTGVPFNPTNTVTCTADYTVTQADLDRGYVLNEASGSAIYAPLGANIPVLSPADTARVDAAVAPGLTVTKTVDPVSGASLGDTLTYTITTRNTGNQTLSNVTVDDPMLATLSCSAAQPATLAPSQELVCTGTHVVTQANIDNELISNTATADGSSPQGTPVSDDGTVTHVPELPAPGLTVAKTGTLNDPDGDGLADAGETISYTITVTNSGNQTLTAVEVTDALFTPSLLGTIASFPPGSVQTYTRSFTLTQSAVDALNAGVQNTAAATGDDPDGDPITEDATITTTLPRGPEIALAKSGVFIEVVQAGRQNAGDRIDYTFTVTNTGNVTLTGVEVTDPLLGGAVGTIASLAPGASQDVTASYTLTQADIDAGHRDNTAEVSGDGSDGSVIPATVTDTDVADVTFTRAPSVALEKVGTYVDGGDGIVNAGDTISYAFTVTNTGNVTLTDVVVSDTLAGLTLSGGPVASLAPGAVDSTTFTASLTLTQAQIDAGEVENLASVTGDDPTGSPVTDASDDPANPADTDPDGDGNPDDPTIVPLNRLPVAEDDTLTGLATGTPATLNPLGNDSDPDGALDPSSVVFTEAGAPAGSTLSTDGKTLTVPGEGVWTIDLTTGAVTFTPEDGFTANPRPVAYTVADPQGQVSNPATITLTFVAQPPVAQDDVVTGLATGTPATLNPLGNDSDPDGALDPASVVFTEIGAPAGSTVSPDRKTLTVPGEGVWTIDPATGAVTFTPEDSFTANPRPVTYTVADNDGNVSNPATITLTFTPQPPVAQDDAVTGLETGRPAILNPLGNDSDPDGTLDPNSMVFTEAGAPTGSTLSADGRMLTVPGEGVWTIDSTSGAVTFIPAGGFTANPTPVVYTVADNDGNVSNPATITLTFAAELPVAEDDTVTGLFTGTPATVNPLDNDSDPDGVLDPTSVIFTEIGVPSGSTLSPDGKTLTVPGEGVWTIDLATGAVTFTPADGFTANPTAVVYTVADNDGNVSNPATITLTFIAEPPVAESDAITGLPTNTPATLNPLGNDGDLDGAIDPTSVVFLGTGTPTGSTLSPDGKTLTVPGEGVWTVDPVTGAVTFTPAEGFTSNPTLVVYTVADNDGNVSNPATITLTFIAEPPVAEDDLLEGLEPGSIAVIDVLGNDGDPDGTLDPASVRIVGAPGDGRTLTVEGQGVWTVNPVTGSITFTPEDGFTDDPTPITYTVADNDGNVSNPATVTVTYLGDPMIDLVIGIANIEDTNGNGITDPGDRIYYTFTVTNSGQVPLTGVTITGTSLPMPGLVCTAVNLAVGETAVLVCTENFYTITAADLEAGSVVLNATASGTDGQGEVVDSSDAVVSVPLSAGGVQIEKTAGLGNVRAGQIVPYTITVRNTSTSMPVTVDVVDVMPAGFVYQAGSGRVGGTSVDPTGSGGRLVFNDVTVAPSGSTVIRLAALVTTSARPGANTNTAQALNPLTGEPVSNKATATVMLEADPVFDCGTVIGRVFDDVNQDGYMNGPIEDRGLTDQTYVPDGKYGRKAEGATVRGGEEGLAGVRLVTVNGTFITTDEFGRFHVPCADLPRDIGSNFLLKLDERTLPSGYRMTTENPRVVRLTAGKMTEMNFGAAITRVVKVDLSNAAFLTGEDAKKPRPELVKGLQGMVAQIASTPSVLRLTYILAQDDEKLAKLRLREVEKLVKQLWRDQGRYKLNVETVIQREKRAGNE